MELTFPIILIKVPVILQTKVNQNDVGICYSTKSSITYVCARTHGVRCDDSAGVRCQRSMSSRSLVSTPDSLYLGSILVIFNVCTRKHAIFIRAYLILLPKGLAITLKGEVLNKRTYPFNQNVNEMFFYLYGIRRSCFVITVIVTSMNVPFLLHHLTRTPCHIPLQHG